MSIINLLNRQVPRLARSRRVLLCQLPSIFLVQIIHKELRNPNGKHGGAKGDGLSNIEVRPVAQRERDCQGRAVTGHCCDTQNAAPVFFFFFKSTNRVSSKENKPNNQGNLYLLLRVPNDIVIDPRKHQNDSRRRPGTNQVGRGVRQLLIPAQDENQPPRRGQSERPHREATPVPVSIRKIPDGDGRDPGDGVNGNAQKLGLVGRVPVLSQQDR